VSVGSGGLAIGESGLRLSCFPIPGQELVEPLSGMIRDTGEDIGEPGLTIDVIHFTGHEQSHHPRRALAAAVRAAEEPGLAAQGHPSDPALGGIVNWHGVGGAPQVAQGGSPY
jgi:hypothetical protein